SRRHALAAARFRPAGDPPAKSIHRTARLWPRPPAAPASTPRPVRPAVQMPRWPRARCSVSATAVPGRRNRRHSAAAARPAPGERRRRNRLGSAREAGGLHRALDLPSRAAPPPAAVLQSLPAPAGTTPPARPDQPAAHPFLPAQERRGPLPSAPLRPALAPSPTPPASAAQLRQCGRQRSCGNSQPRWMVILTIWTGVSGLSLASLGTWLIAFATFCPAVTCPKMV